MIPTSEAWRFVAPLEETNYWEDTIAQHQMTEHRAIRRSFAEVVVKDEAVMEEIVGQVRLAAACNPSALPRLFQLETLGNTTTLVFEYIEGRTLEEMINHETYKKSLNWCRGAIRLVSELAELRRCGARFERLDAAQILVTEDEQMRIRQRSPIGNPSPEALAGSALLKRLHQLPRSGVYTSEEHVDPLGERKLVATLLLQMAAASTKIDLETWASKSPRPEYGHDGVLSQLINRVRGGDFDSLDRLVSEIRSIMDAEATRYQKEAQTAAFESAPSPPAASPAAASRPTQRKTPAAAELNPWAPPPQAPTANGDPAPRTWGVAPAAEDANPWAAPAPAVEGGESTTGAPKPAPAVAKPVAAPARRSKGLPIGLIAGVVGVLVVLIGVYFVIDFMRVSSAPPNQQPIAEVKQPASVTVKAESRVRLDARGSRDPDGTAISYKWEVIEPQTTSVIWTNPGERVGKDTRLFLTKESEVDVQFMVPGTVTVQLTVGDEASWSDPVRLTFTVVPAF